MDKATRLIGLLLLLAVTGCSSPTDGPALRWISLMGEQTELVKAGRFNAQSFERDAVPIVEELARHRDAKSGKLLMTADVLEQFRAANTAFEQACTEKGDKTARAAFDRVVAPLLAPHAEPES